MATLPQDPIPLRGVNVFVTHEVAFNLERMQRVTQEVLNRLGCGGCHSGRILQFQMLDDFVVNAKTLEVQEILPGAIVR
jgi:hypothetical protein